MDNLSDKSGRALEEVVVLYVEDEDEVRELAAKYLHRRVPNLLVAGSGEEALVLSEGKQIDILVTDINMKTIDGAELAMRIKETNPSCYIIFSTAYSNTDRLMQAIDIKVDKYMVKPVDWKELVKTIENYADQMFMVNHIEEETEPIGMNIISGDVYKALRESLSNIEESIASLSSDSKITDNMVRSIRYLELARERIEKVLDEHF